MEQRTCTKLNHHFYLNEAENASPQMIAIATFLTTDFISFGKYFKEWISTDDSGTGGNISYLDREGDEIVLSFDPVLFGPEVIFKASQAQFLNIMLLWEKLCHEGWNEIIITLNGDEVTMEGKN